MKKREKTANGWEGRKSMRKSVEMSYKKPKKLPTLVTLSCLLILTGCATPDRETASGTPMGLANATCIVLTEVKVNRGKPGGPTTEDIAAALDRDRPIERVRNLVGDTSSTLTQVDANNARLKSLCGESNGAPNR